MRVPASRLSGSFALPKLASAKAKSRILHELAPYTLQFDGFLERSHRILRELKRFVSHSLSMLSDAITSSGNAICECRNYRYEVRSKRSNRTGNHSFCFQERRCQMDSIRGIFGVGVAQLMVLSVLVPAYADMNEGDEEHRRLHGRRHSHVVSHDRNDYPVIANWLTSPESSRDAATPDGNDAETK